MNGLAKYFYKSLIDKDEIDDRGFSAVFTARLTNNARTLAVKKLLDSSNDAKKTLIKESGLLRKLNHPNFVQIEGISFDKYAMLLEYVFFDFKPIGRDERAHNLAGFLTFSKQFNCEGIDLSALLDAALDVAVGLNYLHKNDMSHGDLKTDNILVYNHHCHHITNTDVLQQMISIKPLICKLADFSESRARDIQIEKLLRSKTSLIE